MKILCDNSLVSFVPLKNKKEERGLKDEFLCFPVNPAFGQIRLWRTSCSRGEGGGEGGGRSQDTFNQVRLQRRPSMLIGCLMAYLANEQIVVN